MEKVAPTMDYNQRLKMLMADLPEEWVKEEAEKEAKDKAKRLQYMRAFIDQIRGKELEINEFAHLTCRNYIAWSYRKGEDFMIFPEIIEMWTLLDDYAPLGYKTPPPDECIACNGDNAFGLTITVRNKRIRNMSHKRWPRNTKTAITLECQ
jgi:hypothetical protein